MGKGSEDNEHKQWKIKVFYTPILHKRYTSGSKHVIRGGSWYGNANLVARGFRGSCEPNKSTNSDLGLRVVCRP